MRLPVGRRSVKKAARLISGIAVLSLCPPAPTQVNSENERLLQERVKRLISTTSLAPSDRAFVENLGSAQEKLWAIHCANLSSALMGFSFGEGDRKRIESEKDPRVRESLIVPAILVEAILSAKNVPGDVLQNASELKDPRRRYEQVATELIRRGALDGDRLDKVIARVNEARRPLVQRWEHLAGSDAKDQLESEVPPDERRLLRLFAEAADCSQDPNEPLRTIDGRLLTASSGADAARTLDLLAQSASPNVKGADCGTPLMAWAKHGNPAVLRKLIASGAHVNAKGPHGLTALHLAVIYNRPEAEEVLKSAGSLVSKDNFGLLPTQYRAMPNPARLHQLLSSAYFDLAYAGRRVRTPGAGAPFMETGPSAGETQSITADRLRAQIAVRGSGNLIFRPDDPAVFNAPLNADIAANGQLAGEISSARMSRALNSAIQNATEALKSAGPLRAALKQALNDRFCGYGYCELVAALGQ